MLTGLSRGLLRSMRSSSFTDESDESKFRKAIGDAIPWSLDAASLSSWFEENWVNHQEGISPNNAHSRRRRELVRRLEGTNGFELLAACATEVSKVPFVRISRTRNGKMVNDQDIADDLTAFLHIHAGLGFYFQLYSSASGYGGAVAQIRVRAIFEREHRRSRDSGPQQQKRPNLHAQALA